MNITICPRCKKAVEAKDFMNPAYLEALDSISPKIDHACGYKGLPITISKKELKEK